MLIRQFYDKLGDDQSADLFISDVILRASIVNVQCHNAIYFNFFVNIFKIFTVQPVPNYRVEPLQRKT